jgi:hypothetical protein
LNRALGADQVRSWLTADDQSIYSVMICSKMSEEAIGVAKWLVGIDTGGTFTDLIDGLSDGELLRKAARELAMAVYLVAHMMLRQEAEALVITRTGAVAILVRALADSMRSVTATFGQALNMRSAKPAADRDPPQ